VFILFSLALCLAGGAPAASAATITFSGSAGGPFVGPLVEGDLTITLHSGGIFVDLAQGNPAPEAEGSIADGGGTLSVERNDVINGLFLFDEASVAQFGFGATSIVFEDYLGGVLQASDAFLSSNTDLLYTTHSSLNLAGVPIDELRVVLDAGSGPFRWEGVDNITLVLIPESSTGMLLGLGLVLLAVLRRPSTHSR
jgi:hypothetical protein